MPQTPLEKLIAETQERRDRLPSTTNAWLIENSRGEGLAMVRRPYDEVREALSALIWDVEHKAGDPHTLRHAKAALHKD